MTQRGQSTGQAQGQPACGGHRELKTQEGQGVVHKGQILCPRLGCCYIFNAPAMLRSGAGGGGEERDLERWPRQ